MALTYQGRSTIDLAGTAWKVSEDRLANQCASFNRAEIFGLRDLGLIRYFFPLRPRPARVPGMPALGRGFSSTSGSSAMPSTSGSASTRLR